MQPAIRSFATLGFALALAAIAPAAVLNVPSAAYPTIQSAINAAATGDQVVIAAGTYRESLDWESKDLVLKGAGADQTIVDPSPSDNSAGPRCLYAYNLTSASKIDGITFQNGLKNNNFQYGPVGGAILMEVSSPIITNCAFRGNGADGGGAICSDLSNLSLDNCTFTDNAGGTFVGTTVLTFDGVISISNCTFARNKSARLHLDSQVVIYGGTGSSITGSVFEDTDGTALEIGAENFTVSNCTFARNYGSLYGSGASLTGSGTVSNCTFDSNQGGQGGGLGLDGFEGTITDCRFLNNRGYYSGGLDNQRSGALRLSRCTFVGNSGSYAGGINSASPGTRIDNCLFANNSGYYSGAMFTWSRADTVMTNSTLVGNSWYGSEAAKGASAVRVGNPEDDRDNSSFTMVNSIVWNNGPIAAIVSGSNVLTSVTSSLIQGLPNSTPDANGNFAADPQFLRLPGANGPSDAGDLRLPLSSPAVDAGSDAAVTGIVSDILGLARKSRVRVDLGAYEYQNQAPSLSVPATLSTLIGTPVSFQAVSTDADGDAISYQLVGAPAWASVNALTGLVTLNPPAGSAGNVDIVVRATDPFAAATDRTARVVVSVPIAIERVVVSRKGTTTTVQFDVRNMGQIVVSNVSINSVSLKGVATTTLLPLTYAQLKPGVVKTVQLKFSNVSSGSARLLVAGSSSVGAVNADRTVTVP